MKNKNREQFKRLLTFLAAFIIIAVFGRLYAPVWYLQYNKGMLDPFWYNGNILMVAIYVLLYSGWGIIRSRGLSARRYSAYL